MYIPVFLALALAAGLTPRAATAEQSWRSISQDGYGAIICPGSKEMAEMGHFFCVSLECEAEQGPLEYRVRISGGGTTSDFFPATLSVDGQKPAALVFQKTPETNYLEYRAPFDPQTHPRLIEALQKGTQALIILDPAGDNIEKDIPLAGSSAAIQHALRRCRLP